MRLVPTFDDIADAMHAINAQHPSLSDDAPATTLANETDGDGRRVLRLTAQQVVTIVHGLAVHTVQSHRVAPTIGQVLASIRLERLPNGSVRAAEPREAVPQVALLFALELARREHPEHGPDVCWHCHVCLTPAPAPRHCESCPPEGECDVEGCAEPGCEGR
jgi:hypothetical protein